MILHKQVRLWSFGLFVWGFGGKVYGFLGCVGTSFEDEQSQIYLEPMNAQGWGQVTPSREGLLVLELPFMLVVTCQDCLQQDLSSWDELWGDIG